MAANKNTKAVHSARARNAASNRKDRRVNASSPLLPTRRSARQTRCIAPQSLDGSHSGTPGLEESRAPSLMHENPEPGPVNIENLQAPCDALQVEATSAARRGGEKPAEVCQLEQEIARVRTKLVGSSISGRLTNEGYSETTDSSIDL